MTRSLWTATLLAALVAVPAGATAQAQDDPIARHLYPPELVMQHQNRIDLSDDQKSSIRREVLEAQTTFTELQWEFQDAAEELAGLLAAERPDETRVLEQVDRVLDKERVIKHTQIRLMVRIKNLLTPQQHALLDELRPERRPPPRRPQP